MLKSLYKITGNFFGTDTPVPPDDYTLDLKKLKTYYEGRSVDHPPSFCYAPFKNIYFGHEGRVVACCFNRKHVLGVYPEKTIKEIWLGKEAEQLRSHLKKNDLSLGCHTCRAYFNAGNLDGISAKMYDGHPVNSNGFPSVMEFEISNTCNLECIMCSGEFSSSIRKNREHKPVIREPYDADFIQQLTEFIPWLSEAKFYGGEPFLVPLYYEIWDQIISINPTCRLSVQTNATVYNRRVTDLLGKATFHINISLDSLEEKTFESIRINAPFNLVMKNIESFHRYCKSKNSHMGISVCVMRQNWKELPDFIRYCNTMDVPVYFHSVWFPPDCSLWNLDSHALSDIHSYLSGFTFPGDSPVERKNKNHYEDTLHLIDRWRQDALQRDSLKRQTSGVAKSCSLRNRLLERIAEHIMHLPGMPMEEKNQKIASCLAKTNHVMDLLEREKCADETIELIHDIPIGILVAELEVNSEEKLLRQALAFRNNI